MDGKIFEQWAGAFIKFIAEERKKRKNNIEFDFLITDGHNSRKNAKLLWNFLINKILVLNIGSQTSYLIQPNDSGLNRAFKTNMDSELAKFVSANITLDKCHICPIAARCLKFPNIPGAIVNSFKHIGIIPLDYEKMKAVVKNFEAAKIPDDVASAINLVTRHSTAIKELQQWYLDHQGYQNRKKKPLWSLKPAS